MINFFKAAVITAIAFLSYTIGYYAIKEGTVPLALTFNMTPETAGTTHMAASITLVAVVYIASRKAYRAWVSKETRYNRSQAQESTAVTTQRATNGNAVYTKHDADHIIDFLDVEECSKEGLNEQAQQELDKIKEDSDRTGTTNKIEKQGDFVKRMKKELILMMLLLLIGGMLWFLATSFELGIVESYSKNRGRYFRTDGNKEFALFVAPYLLVVSYRFFRKSLRIIKL